ncbi:MAG: 2-oxoacid:acceptor oxidoreductase family protein [Oscillospiraceae bacterium]|nr:2-oxoacid:acceptor oxidoreductase family protein [Oscillospiraceae bacterium]
MTTQILWAGFGGQGALFAGQFLANAGLIRGQQVSWLPSYGPEMRGGTANCSVILSDDAIGSPIVLQPDVLVCMNLPSFLRFGACVRPGGKLFVDSSLVEERSSRADIAAYYIPAAQLASDEGMAGLANMIFVGKVIAATGLFDEETVTAAMHKAIHARKQHLLEMNLRAVELGRNYREG